MQQSKTWSVPSSSALSFLLLLVWIGLTGGGCDHVSPERPADAPEVAGADAGVDAEADGDHDRAQGQARGRVQVVGNNVVSDTGQPLRGTAFFLDIFGIPDMQANEAQYREYFRQLSTDYNVNLVRISPWVGNWAYMIKGEQWYDDHRQKFTYMIDKVVEWAREDGIYVVVNMHIRFGTVVDLQKTKDFWDVFAPRYKDETHVIYEAVNEPDVPSAKAQMSAVYAHIRGLAPNTHIILWSLVDPEKISAGEIWDHSGGISYANASVGFHDYDFLLGKTLRWDLGDSYRQAGLPAICTEFYSLTNADFYPIDYSFMADNIRMAEERGFSWIQWSPVANYRNTNQELTHDDVKYSQRYWDELAAVGVSPWARDNGSANPPPPGTGTLAGSRRIQDGWNGRYLHASANYSWAPVTGNALNSDWTSQQWEFESVEGNVYRLKNRWTGGYLTAPSDEAWDALLVAELEPTWMSQQWEVEATGSEYRLKNRWSGLYVHAQANGGDPTLQAPLETSWGSQKFRLEAAF